MSIVTVTGQCDAITNGGYLTQNAVISQWDSPCVVQKDLIIAKKYTLTLQPGVELRFLPGVMLAVNGTLLAKVYRRLVSNMQIYRCTRKVLADL